MLEILGAGSLGWEGKIAPQCINSSVHGYICCFKSVHIVIWLRMGVTRGNFWPGGLQLKCLLDLGKKTRATDFPSSHVENTTLRGTIAVIRHSCPKGASWF